MRAELKKHIPASPTPTPLITVVFLLIFQAGVAFLPATGSVTYNYPNTGIQSHPNSPLDPPEGPRKGHLRGAQMVGQNRVTSRDSSYYDIIS